MYFHSIPWISKNRIGITLIQLSRSPLRSKAQLSMRPSVPCSPAGTRHLPPSRGGTEGSGGSHPAPTVDSGGIPVNDRAWPPGTAAHAGHRTTLPSLSGVMPDSLHGIKWAGCFPTKPTHLRAPLLNQSYYSLELDVWLLLKQVSHKNSEISQAQITNIMTGQNSFDISRNVPWCTWRHPLLLCGFAAMTPIPAYPVTQLAHKEGPALQNGNKKKVFTPAF